MKIILNLMTNIVVQIIVTVKNERTFSERAHSTPRLPSISYWRQHIHEIYPNPHPKKVILLTDFSEEQSYSCLIPSMFLLLLTTSQNLCKSFLNLEKKI
jgi:hypothetical protein